MDKHGSILWIKTYAAGLGKVFSFVVPLILGGVVNLGLYYWLKPGMWLAILIFLLSTMPVIYIYLKISQAFNEYSFIESKLVEVLNKDIDVFSSYLTVCHKSG